MSSVDPVSEAAIREGLSRLFEGRTSLVIAHRLSTIQRADRILVLHRGQVSETGRLKADIQSANAEGDQIQGRLRITVAGA